MLYIRCDIHSRSRNIKAVVLLAIKSGANLSGTNLYGADLRGADLSGTNLSGANLYGASGKVLKLAEKYKGVL